MDTGIEEILVPEPIISRPIQELREIEEAYRREMEEERDREEREYEEYRALLPEFMASQIDLLA